MKVSSGDGDEGWVLRGNDAEPRSKGWSSIKQVLFGSAVRGLLPGGGDLQTRSFLVVNS